MKPLFYLSLLLLFIPSAASSHRVGVWCTNSYENGWQDSIYSEYERCDALVDDIGDTDTIQFYAPIDGAKSWIEETNDQWMTENGDLVWITTHGGYGYNDANLCMWDEDVYVHSTDMRLGDDSYGTSIFSMYSCETMNNDDGRRVLRWMNALEGGLRLLCGSINDLVDSYWTINDGVRYSNSLQATVPLAYAWRDAFVSNYTHEDLAVMACSTTFGDATWRLNNMRWKCPYFPLYVFNSPIFPRRRDGDCNSFVTYEFENVY